MSDADHGSTPSSRARMEVRLVGGPHPDGEVPLGALAGIAQTVQDLVSRLAREVSGRSGAGRTPDELSDMSRLLLVGLRAGSTTLEIAGPEVDMELDLGRDIPADAGTQALERFALVLESVAAPKPALPPDLDSPAARSASELLEALAPYPQVDVELEAAGRRHQVRLRPTAIAAALRQDDPAAETTEPYAVSRTVAGVLYALNLHTGRFQVEDDLGATIDLSVPPALRPGALRLVDQRVVATGVAQSTGGRLRLVEVTGIEPAGELPGIDADAFRRPANLADLLRAATPLASLDDLVVEGLTDAEALAFLTALD